MLKKAIVPLLMVAALSGCAPEAAEVVETPVRPVKVVEIAEAASTRTLSYSGSIRARSDVAAGFRVAGKIMERKVNIGDRVKAGDLLARLDDTDYKLSLESAKASLMSAERQVETADFAMKRAEQLFARQVVPKAQLEQAELVYRQAIAGRDSARAALAQAQNQVEYSLLKADRDGIVTAVNADAGQVVAAGSPVVTVAVDGEKEVSISVPESDILAFKPGLPVKVSLWSNIALELSGTVREVSGSADSASRTFSVRVSLPQDERVLLGMTASVIAAAESGQSSYSVPLSALARDAADKTLVWTVDRAAETVHARPVTVAEFGDNGVKIADGLKPGDIVVVAGTQFMTEDLKVKLPSEIQQSAQVSDTASSIQIR
ncbi:efflux RND transporter periplasmic adaptor subunit [Rhizobium sp. RU36D]|uniref:efflux RND transporter periplasmic adaptor subunit n=1 Tax=Rhizobium sp. RU36D TaxID=1907415 RepID=UPI0009D8D621|nr:efflux RND transporter periplasmic adaptor subunit [Rhizobium sp. RU36D]SMD19744.1 RND family efflux transporter, MFP subunit [Rhizobium sp. RU36D]